MLMPRNGDAGSKHAIDSSDLVNRTETPCGEGVMWTSSYTIIGTRYGKARHVIKVETC